MPPTPASEICHFWHSRQFSHFYRAFTVPLWRRRSTILGHWSIWVTRKRVRESLDFRRFPPRASILDRIDYCLGNLIIFSGDLASQKNQLSVVLYLSIQVTGSVRESFQTRALRWRGGACRACAPKGPQSLRNRSSRALNCGGWELLSCFRVADTLLTGWLDTTPRSVAIVQRYEKEENLRGTLNSTITKCCSWKSESWRHCEYLLHSRKRQQCYHSSDHSGELSDESFATWVKQLAVMKLAIKLILLQCDFLFDIVTKRGF